MYSGFRAGLIAATAIAAPALADCRIDAANLDLAAKTRFQQGVFAAVVLARPELTEVARANRDLQIAMATSRRMRLTHLAHAAPDRLVTDRGVAAFSNADWTKGDDNALRASDPEYDRLAGQIPALSAASQGHPDWPALREWVREDPVGRAAITSLAEALRSGQADVLEALAACR